MTTEYKADKISLLITILSAFVFFWTTSCSSNFCKSIDIGTDKEIAELNKEFLNIIPETRVCINYPAPEYIKEDSPIRVVMYALPNGNTIEQTAGKKIQSGDDWHYDIQHIAAQTRFIRAHDPSYNYIVVYLESETRAWTSHAAKYPNSPALYIKLVDSIEQIVSQLYTATKAKPMTQEIILCSHSGGGRFVLNYISGSQKIPREIKKIAFIDSNYGFEEEQHTQKLFNWINEDNKRALSVIAYIDSTVILNGKPIVSKTGGTGYKSELMYRALKNRGLIFTEVNDTSFIKHNEKNGRVKIWIKKNPKGQIYHTVLVEKNGFIQSVFCSDANEEQAYRFWKDRAYRLMIK